MLTIKILGAGCPNCKRLEAEARAALESIDPKVSYELIKVTDITDIMAYRVLSTPALVIDEQVLSSGRIPRREQIVRWALEAQSK